MKVKVLIIGAGPSGSSCGIRLLQAGVDCLLVDKQKFPRVKLCAGLFTHKSQECLKNLLGERSYDSCLEETLDSKEENFRLYNRTELLVECKPKEPITLISRPKFDLWMVEHYKSLGGRFLENKELIGIDHTRKVATFHDMEVEYECLVAADGANSAVERLLVQQNNASFVRKSRSSMCIEINVERKDLDVDGVNIYFNYAKNSYAWSFSKGEKICLGLVKLSTETFDANASMRHFISELNLKNPDKYPFRGAMIPIGNSMRHPFYGNIMFVGDAAGLVEPLTEEGIYYALQSGVYAAEALVSGNSFPALIYDNKVKYLRKLIEKGAFYQRLLEKQWCVNIFFDHAHRHPRFINHFYYTQIEHACLDSFLKIVLKYKGILRDSVES